MNTHRLQFELRSYWHPGTGHGSGSALDALTHRDGDGLPALPGRTVKGLLRDALQSAVALGWLSDPRDVHRLCGWRPTPEQQTRPEPLPAQGCLRVSDATLPAEVAAYLAANPALIAGLYRSHFATAVDSVSGTATQHSLRGIEVVVPLTLEARISILPGSTTPDDWAHSLATALPLLDQLGSHRNRGMGRVVVSLGEPQ